MNKKVELELLHTRINNVQSIIQDLSNILSDDRYQYNYEILDDPTTIEMLNDPIYKGYSHSLIKTSDLVEELKELSIQIAKRILDYE